MHAAAFAVLSLLVAVRAQDNATSSGNTIESGCQSFLSALDTNTNLASCLTSITTATAAFTNTSETPASSDVSSTLDTLCASTACSSDDIVSLLTTFGLDCADDLVTNQDVSSRYDMLYNLMPMRNTLCTKDGATYCALNPNVVGSTDALELPTGEEAQIVMANLDAIGTANALFDFLTPNTAVTALCSTCFQNILIGFVDWEDAIPYATGVNLSPLLQGQSELWAAVTNNCSSEVAGNVAVQGGASDKNSSAAIPAYSVNSATGAAAAFGVALFALAL